MAIGVFLDKKSLDQQDLDFTRLQASLENWQIHDATTPSQVDERLAEAEVVVSNKVVLTAEHIANASKLKLICVAATGTNNIDLQAAQRCGIAVCNVRAYATPSVVQHAFGLILNLLD